MKVSVLVLVYNHEPFLQRCLESAQSQKTDFDFEIVVGEDRSRDGSRRLLSEIERRSPHRLRLLLHETHLGMYENVVRTLEACSGEYVALLEGDDYWTSDHKLQLQAAYLDAHPECVMCFHDAEVVHEDGRLPPRRYCSPRPAARSTLADILRRNFIPTASVMFRRAAVGRLPEWLRSARMLDWPLHILNARQGDIGYIDEVMAVYRIHGGGVWSGQSQIPKLEEELRLYGLMEPELPDRWRRHLRSGASRRCFDLAWAHAGREETGRARRYARRSLRIQLFNPAVATRELVKLFLRLYLPGLNRRLLRLRDALRGRKPPLPTPRCP